MAERLRSVGCPVTVAATTVLALVFVWRMPVLAQAAGYLVLVGAGVVVLALAAVGRMLAGRPDGRVLAIGAATLAFVGQALNSSVGLPAAGELQGGVGTAGVVTLACEVLIVVLGVRDLRRLTPPGRAR